MESVNNGYVLAQMDERYLDLMLKLDREELIEIDKKLRLLDAYTYDAFLDSECNKLVDSF